MIEANLINYYTHDINILQIQNHPPLCLKNWVMEII